MLRKSKVLPNTGNRGYASIVTAKSVIGIITPSNIKGATVAPQAAFLLPAYQHPPFMAGLVGLPSGRPVPFDAGGDNPISPVTSPRLSPPCDSSKQEQSKEARMPVTCRIAVLKGNSSRLSTCKVEQYKTITAPSFKAMTALAARQNAVICSWYPVRRAIA